MAETKVKTVKTSRGDKIPIIKQKGRYSKKSCCSNCRAKVKDINPVYCANCGMEL